MLLEPRDDPDRVLWLCPAPVVVRCKNEELTDPVPLTAWFSQQFG